MNKELLELAAKPKRKAFEAEVEQTKQRAYERSFKQAAKEIAQVEGAAAGAAAAAGTGGSALERARARALGGLPQALAPAEQGTQATIRRPASAVAAAKPSGQFIQRPNGSRVPIEYFDLPREQQANFDALVAEAEAEAAGESRFDQTALGLVDQLLSQSKRIKSLEGQLTVAVAAMEALQRRIDGIDTTIEVAKSEALEGQESSIAQMATNLLTIKLQASAEMEQYNRQRGVVTRCCSVSQGESSLPQ